jgi:hypothetical protein
MNIEWGAGGEIRLAGFRGGDWEMQLLGSIGAAIRTLPQQQANKTADLITQELHTPTAAILRFGRAAKPKIPDR